MSPSSHLELARSTTRDQFIAACQFPFLVGEIELVKPKAAQRTESHAILDFDGPDPKTVGMGKRPELPPAAAARPATQLWVMAVRKVQLSFPAMITVGRTANNDLVLNDVQVSKFHAFFRVTHARYELFDAGSRNGTFVGDVALPPRGTGLEVRSGVSVRFAHLAFDFLEPGACWDRVRPITGRHAEISPR